MREIKFRGRRLDDGEGRKVMSDWPKLIKAARLHIGETQTQFAKHFGVAPNTVSRWETGQYDISLEAIDWLLESMGMKPALCKHCGGTGLVARKPVKRSAA